MENRKHQLHILAALLLIFSAVWFLVRKQSDLKHPEAEPSASYLSGIFKTSDRTVPDSAEERRRKEAISLAAQKWHEELLDKYPDFKPTYRDVPDERNGYLQFLLFAEKLTEPKLTKELHSMLAGESTWDAATFKTWLSENKDYCDQILHIAELPDRSIKGIDIDRIFHGLSKYSSEFKLILNASARLAFESGDQASALRYTKAAISLSDHFTDIEVPSLIGEVIATGIRTEVTDSFFERMLPALVGDTQALKTWREAIFRKEKPASELARILYGDWNTTVRTDILPELLGYYPRTNGLTYQIPDADAFFDLYSAAVRNSAASLSDRGPDRLDLSHIELVYPTTGIEKKTNEMLQRMHFISQGVYQSLGTNITHRSLQAAAIAIMLGEEPAPDPVSGKAFQWNPITRILTSPEDEHGFEMKVP